MSATDLKTCLTKCIDKTLGVRDLLGANKAKTSIITRTWSGDRPGDGNFTDVEKEVLPSPEIKDFSHDLRVQQAGAYKQGDLILRGISRNKFPEEEELLTRTEERNVEKFIKVGRHYYRTINIKEELVTWEIQVRKIAHDETERG